ncbi:MAG: GNAT family protein [Anaerolineae bacterium]
MAGIDKPILFDFPDHFETELLLLRAPRPGDGQILNDAIRQSQEHLKPWMPWAETLETVAQSEESMRRQAANWLLRTILWLMIFRKSDGAFVGRCGLHDINWSVPSFEIGYWVRASMEGHGYVTEAVNGLSDFAFDQLHAERIQIRCDPRNVRSAAVARRAGYTEEGIIRNDMRERDDTLSSSQVFSMLRAEWEARKA